MFTAFKDYKKRIMVATDIFRRGIDIVKVNTVINYDMPDNPDSYMHRVGRAGRFGGKGLTITFIADKNDETIFDEIQKRFFIKAQELPKEIDPSTYSKFILLILLFRLNYLIRFYILIFIIIQKNQIYQIFKLYLYYLYFNFYIYIRCTIIIFNKFYCCCIIFFANSL